MVKGRLGLLVAASALGLPALIALSVLAAAAAELPWPGRYQLVTMSTEHKVPMVLDTWNGRVRYIRNKDGVPLYPWDEVNPTAFSGPDVARARPSIAPLNQGAPRPSAVPPAVDLDALLSQADAEDRDRVALNAVTLAYHRPGCKWFNCANCEPTTRAKALAAGGHPGRCCR